jgi:hypothetical protein
MSKNVHLKLELERTTCSQPYKQERRKGEQDDIGTHNTPTRKKKARSKL